MTSHFSLMINRCKSVQSMKEKGVSDTIYKKVLEQRFASIHGQITPKWAQLVKKDDKKTKYGSGDEVEDRDLTKVTFKLYFKCFYICYIHLNFRLLWIFL